MPRTALPMPSLFLSLKELSSLSEHFISSSIRADFLHLAQLLVVSHHRHCLINKHLEPSPQRLQIVILATLVARQNPLLHNFLRTVEEKHERAVHFQQPFERVEVFHVTREAVDEEPRNVLFAHRILHRVF